MQKIQQIAFMSGVAALVAFGGNQDAHALLEECGNIELNTSAQCELQVDGGCDVTCDLSNLTFACAGELYVDCEAMCDADLDVGCTAECTGGCEAECNVDPGNFSCEGQCEASCDANCDAQCQGSANGAECKASCSATCGGECSASCSGTPPSADCKAQCEASCSGECKAEANLDCQGACQADGYVDCKANMQVNCEGQCTRPEGALVCDGQFVDAADVNSCIGALQQTLDIQVDVSGSADAECANNQCNAKAEGSVACAVVPPTSGEGSRAPGGWLWVAGAALGLAQWRRRRS